MLAEERFREIQKYVESHGTVTVQELTDLLNTSESTVRRDLTELHKRGTLIKVSRWSDNCWNFREDKR